MLDIIYHGSKLKIVFESKCEKVLKEVGKSR